MDCTAAPVGVAPVDKVRSLTPPLRNSQLLGLLLLLSVSLQSTKPSLNALSVSLSLYPTPDSEQFNPTFSHDDVEDPGTQSRFDPSFDYYEATEGVCPGSVCTVPDVLEVETQRRDDEDDDDEDDDNEDEVREELVHLSSSSIGEEDMSSRPVSTTSNFPSSGKVSPPHPTGLLLKLSSDSFCVHGRKMNSSSFSSSFEEMPESSLLSIMAFLALPEIIALLHTNKKLNAAVRKFFAINEHGVLSIPACTGRSISSRRSIVNSTQMDGNSSSRSSAKNIRLFFGQQRRDNHTSSLRHLLNFLAPDMAIPHTEAHTNPANNRGKGCSWVFVTSQEDAERLTAFNKLIFLDVNERNQEVYRLAPPRSKAWLDQYAQEAGARTARPNYLPRQPFVVEMPEKSSTKRKRMSQKPSPAQPVLQSPQSRQLSVLPQKSSVDENLEETSIVTRTPNKHASTRALNDFPASVNVPSKTFVHGRPSYKDHKYAYPNRGRRGCFPYDCEYYTAPPWPHVYASTVFDMYGKYRHDPYMYNPLWMPSASLLYPAGDEWDYQ